MKYDKQGGTDLPIHKQICNLWKGKKLLKQYEGNIFKCNVFMISNLFVYIILRS